MWFPSKHTECGYASEDSVTKSLGDADTYFHSSDAFMPTTYGYIHCQDIGKAFRAATKRVFTKWAMWMDVPSKLGEGLGMFGIRRFSDIEEGYAYV